MSRIRPFAAIRYSTATDSDVSSRISPPYDILNEQDKQSLLARDPRNFVAIDLPHTPPKAAGPTEAYAGAREILDAWVADGTLVRDERPALYVYYQRYAHAGVQEVRKMFFARLRIEALGAGGVFPHEQTFGGPKEDRLALTKATATNLSPIFGLYQDAENVVTRRLESELAPQPIALGTLDGVEGRLWAVTDAAAIADVVNLLADRPTYIADGHHRYGTATMYRDWLSAEQGPLPDEHPANDVMCVFCAMEDPGLLILPTHRVLPDVTVSRAAFEADDDLEVIPMEATTPDAIVAALAQHGPQAIAACGGTGAGCFAVRPRSADLLRPLAPGHGDAWRGLGLAFLHAYLIERIVKPQGGATPEVHYVKSAGGALAEAESSRGTAFLVQATTMEELRAVCQAGDLMPPKSTYFYPKLASGLVINPLT